MTINGRKRPGALRHADVAAHRAAIDAHGIPSGWHCNLLLRDRDGVDDIELRRGESSLGMAEGFVPVDGGQLYYEAVGEGPVLVLVHAGIADSRMWDGQMPAFSDTHRVVRYDVRNFGLSSIAEKDFAHHEDLKATTGDI